MPRWLFWTLRGGTSHSDPITTHQTSALANAHLTPPRPTTHGKAKPFGGAPAISENQKGWKPVYGSPTFTPAHAQARCVSPAPTRARTCTTDLRARSPQRTTTPYTSESAPRAAEPVVNGRRDSEVEVWAGAGAGDEIVADELVREVCQREERRGESVQEGVP
jgi:hypothetical protein